MKHTRGPWHVSDSGTEIEAVSDHRYQIYDERMYWLANINKCIDNHKKNAHLMAAAPEMLEMLKRIYNQPMFKISQVTSEEIELFKDLSSLIQKAEGETPEKV